MLFKDIKDRIIKSKKNFYVCNNYFNFIRKYV